MRKISEFNTLSKNQKTLTLINHIISILFILTLISFIITILILGDPTNRLVACICGIFCYILPYFIQLISKTRLSPSLIMIYLIFVTIASFLGSCLNLNYIIPFFDKIQHFSWGYIACVIGLYLLCRSKEFDKLKISTIIIIFISISLATAGLWEVIEFTGDKLFNQTAQGIQINDITAVDDAMFDIIVHTLGTILFTLHFILDKTTNKNLGITSLIRDFKTNY